MRPSLILAAISWLNFFAMGWALATELVKFSTPAISFMFLCFLAGSAAALTYWQGGNKNASKPK